MRILEQYGGLDTARLLDYVMIMVNGVTDMVTGHFQILDHLFDLGLDPISNGLYMYSSEPLSSFSEINLMRTVLAGKNMTLFTKLVDICKVRGLAIASVSFGDVFFEIARAGHHPFFFTAIEERVRLLINCGLNPNKPSSRGLMLSEILQLHIRSLRVQEQEQEHAEIAVIIERILSLLPPYDRETLVDSIIKKIGSDTYTLLPLIRMFSEIMDLAWGDQDIGSSEQWLNNQDLRRLEAFNQFSSLSIETKLSLCRHKSDSYTVCKYLKLSDVCPDHEYHLEVEPLSLIHIYRSEYFCK